jgi:hypothetical protein
VIRVAGEDCQYAPVCNQLGDAGIVLDEDEFTEVKAEVFRDGLPARRKKLLQTTEAKAVPEPEPDPEPESNGQEAGELNRRDRSAKVRAVVLEHGRDCDLATASREAGFDVSSVQLANAKRKVFGSKRAPVNGTPRPVRKPPPRAAVQTSAPVPAPPADRCTGGLTDRWASSKDYRGPLPKTK